MSGKPRSLQDVFLNEARKEKMQVTVYLTNGFQLKGYVRGFDNFTVVLDSDDRQQLIYKHALSTIAPARPLKYTQAEDQEEE
ncbi:MAG: RNA chaperone Hfq [Clostridiales bacterium]|jgi:host factor-I protein|nr:RNA chaperone Hfq [Clostridiales bacterium]